MTKSKLLYAFFPLLICCGEFVINEQKVDAHWVCPVKTPFGSKEELCPHFHPRPSNGGSSCLSVMTYPKKYSWEVKNSKNYGQTFWLDEKKYELGAYKTLYFTSEVGRYSTSSCSSGTNYPEPTIEFDRFVDDGKFTSQKFVVNVTNYKAFEFWNDGNVIKFSSTTQR